MATVNKDFKIKSGLIIEGTTATLNGVDILAKNAGSDTYILNLTGGATLVKTVDTGVFNVDGSGNLTINAETFDDFGSAATAQSAAEATAASDATTKVAAEAALRVSGDAASVATASADATSKADAAQAAAISAAAADATSKANAAQSAAATDATTKANAAVTSANGYTDTAIGTEVTNRDSAISTAISNLDLGNTYDALGAAATAQSNAATYTDTAVASLVDGAPALLDTLNELALALGDSPDTITNLVTEVGLKAYSTDVATDISTAVSTAASDATTKVAAEAALRVSGDAASVSTASADATSKANSAQAAAEATAAGDATSKANAAQAAAEATAAGDATTKANAAQAAAIAYADALDTDDIAEAGSLYFTDARAKTSAADLLTGATLSNITITGTGAGLVITAENGVADSDTDDLDEGTTNLYFTDVRAVDALEAVVPNFTAVELNSVAKQIAATLSAPTAGVQVGHAFAKADYRSAEYLVKVAYATHTEISKVLLTLDTSDNIAITEYGIVGTNGSASAISAGISGTDVQLLVTTANNNSTVTVMGTLLV